MNELCEGNIRLIISTVKYVTLIRSMEWLGIVTQFMKSWSLKHWVCSEVVELNKKMMLKSHAKAVILLVC